MIACVCVLCVVAIFLVFSVLAAIIASLAKVVVAVGVVWLGIKILHGRHWSPRPPDANADESKPR